MSKTIPSFVAFVCLVLFSNAAGAQAVKDDRVASLLSSVSATRLKANIAALVGFGTRSTLSVQSDPKRGIGAAFTWAEAQMKAISQESGGRLLVSRDTFTVPAGGRYPRETSLTNIVATLPGTDLNRVLVVSGHLDSRITDVLDGAHDAPGANDDGSGVVTVLELAHALAPTHPRATITFLIVDGEEQNLTGSGHWAAAAKRSNLPIEAMLDNDIVGNSRGQDGIHDDRHVRVFSEGVPATDDPRAAARRAATGGENDSPSRELARAVADSQRRYLPQFGAVLVYRRDRYLRGGDHISFNEQGYAAVRLTEMNEDFRHQHQDVRQEKGVQYGDLPQFVDYPYLAQVARVNLAALADLSAAPPPPVRIRLITATLSTDTTLRWDTPLDSDCSGYEVLWRRTSAPDWENVKFVGAVGEATLPLSKDDYLFAVRAVSRRGNRSLPAIPVPGAE